jgi:thiosulfate/3-mercaptopyruvate sulfurtransferase
MPPLVTTGWLADHLNDPDVRIVDTRWYLLQPTKGETDYAAAHIPNAVYLSVDRHLAGEPLPDARTGRHPLPGADAFAESMMRAGISHSTHVVAYDDAAGGNAARLWWLLRYFGHSNVSLLDGGLNQWLAEGRPLSSDVPSFPRGEFHARANPNMVVTKSEMIAAARNPHALILDARAGERYRGETEPIDARAGHIPGAKSAPLAENQRSAADFRFSSPADLRARYDALGANGAGEIIAYCGSGVNAAANLFALHLAGYDNTRLYPGSFSEWSRDPDLPIVTGETAYSSEFRENG